MSAPRLAQWLTRRAAPDDRLADMLGDLEEVYQRRRANSVIGAWLTTVAEAVVVCVAMNAERARPSLRLRDWMRGSDIRQGLRLMRREPVVTATATVALALGIGLLTVGVTAVEALLFARLPFENGDRFVQITAWQEPDRRPVQFTPDEYLGIVTSASALTHIGATSQRSDNVTMSSGAVDAATTAGITPSSLPFLPYRPILGRAMSADDARRGAAAVVMIREALWRRAFGGAADAVGATIDVGGVRRTIVGVMPDEFEFPSRPDLWIPIDEAFRDGQGTLALNERLFGVLAPGRTLEEARAEMAAMSARLNTARGVERPVRLDAAAWTDLGPQTPVMLSAILLVVIAILVVVAANVANLILARSFLRSRELAVRAALGASRSRLVGQVVAEVLVLCGVAALVGGVAAQAVLRQFNALDDLPFWIDFTAGPRTMVVVIGATLLATAIAGAWPAWRITKGHLLSALQSSGRGTDVRFGRTAGAMVIVQIAVSIVMLHGSLVLADSLRRYSAGDLDLPANVLTAGLRFSGSAGVVPGRPGPSTTLGEIEELVSAVPGVAAVGVATALPRHSPEEALIEVEPLSGRAAQAPRLAPSAEVSNGFFTVLDATPLVGRLFMPADLANGAPAVAVVNLPFVDKFLAGAFPVGRRFRTVGGGTPGPWHEIVGVVRDLGLSVGDQALAAGYYVPLVKGPGPGRFIYLTMRVDGEPVNYVAPLRRALYAHDPALVLNRPERLDDVASDDRAFFLWFSRALIGLGGVTLVLALTGVYAMMSLIVARRTREIGVRVALGATAQRVVHAVVGRAAAQVVAGGVIGAILAVLSLDLRSVLVSRLGDGGAWTLPVVLTLLVLAGLAATAAPLCRALRIQPADAMRVE